MLEKCTTEFLEGSTGVRGFVRELDDRTGKFRIRETLSGAKTTGRTM